MGGSDLLFSIVVPVFNRAHVITDCLASVRRQTFSSFECLVVDDGSSDGEQLMSAVAELDDQRFLYVRQVNRGGGAARNTGIDAARGRYIAFLDSDDLFLPGKLAYFAQRVTHRPLEAWYSQAIVDRGGGRSWIRPHRAIGPKEDMGEYLFVANQFIQTSTMVVHADAARQVRFDPALRKGQDLDFCMRLYAAGVHFRMSEEPLTIWRDHTEVGRTSRAPGYHDVAQWYRKITPLLTPRTAAAFQSTYMAYHLAAVAPMRALGLILRGFVRGGVPIRVTLRQTLRCLLPRRLYRLAVDCVVGLAGRRAGLKHVTRRQ